MDKRIASLQTLLIFIGYIYFFPNSVFSSPSSDNSQKAKYAVRLDSVQIQNIIPLGIFSSKDVLYYFRYIPWTVVYLNGKQVKVLKQLFPKYTIEIIQPLNSICTFQNQYSDDFFVISRSAFQLTKIEEAHRLYQLTGNGLRIAIMDDGFDPTHSAFQQMRIVQIKNFTDDETILSHTSHGTGILSLLGGISLHHPLGYLQNSEFFLAKVFRSDQEVANDELSWCKALEWAMDQKVHIINNSFVFTVRQALSSDKSFTFELLEELQSRGIFVICAAGNTGNTYRSILHPASYRNVITVGATDAIGNVADFSSKGETIDGVLKPDFCAPATHLLVATTSNQFRRVSGTSFAAPIIVTVIGFVKEKHPNWSYEKILQSIRASSDHFLSPNREVGYGIPNVLYAIDFPLLEIRFSVNLLHTPHYVWLTYWNPPENIEQLKINDSRVILFRNLPMGRYWLGMQSRENKLKIIPLIVSNQNLILDFSSYSSAPKDNK
ncbi:MAG: S8 family serine peptidase [bacterium]|nr:S8 family serine peptidase [bacterium]